MTIVVGDDELDAGIAGVAVLLNRAVWLDPKHLDVQRRTWRTVLDVSRGDGHLVRDDFVLAATDVLRSGATGPVLPHQIIDRAVERARIRREVAENIVRSFAEVPESVVIGLEAVESRAGIEALAVDGERLLACLRTSGLPAAKVDPVCDYITAWFANRQRRQITP